MPGLRWAAAGHGGSRSVGHWLGIAGYLALAGFVLIASWTLLGRMGGEGFLVALIGTLVLAVYSIISFRYLHVPFYVWVLSVCGFRFLWNIQAPGLPDLFLDRITLIWVSLVFLVKSVADNRKMRGPYRLDVLVLLHALYVLGQIFFHEMQYFSAWVASVAMPTAAYYLAKNIVTNRGRIAGLIWVLLGLSVYYNITSVAEKFDLNWLIWPKYIVTAGGEFAGRSQGPFLQAPLFGTVIGMLLPVHLYCLAVTRSNWARVLLGLSLLLGFAGLYFTYTRGSWLAGFMALAATAVLNRRLYARFLIPALVLAPIIAIGFLGLSQDKFMKERLEDEDTIGSRIGTAATVFRVWRDHPLFGVGFFQYRNVRENYIQAVDVPGLPIIRYAQFRNNSIHDIYLGPLAEEGLVGSAMQVAIYVLILNAFLRKYFKRKSDDLLANQMFPVLGGIMVGYLVGGIAFDYRFFAVVGSLFMLCAGITYGYQPQAIAERMEPKTDAQGGGVGRCI